MTLDIQSIRGRFPALHQTVNGGIHPIFLDNPAGTQIPRDVMDAIRHYYETMNANEGGVFATSQRNDAMLYETRVAVADFLHASRPEEIVFGQNMTTLNFALSHTLARQLQPGDEIILTRMDHDANVAPWTNIAQDLDLPVRWVDLDVEDGTLNMATLEDALSQKTKIVATVHASNVLGTVNPLAQIADMAHSVGALHVVDAVQSAPHVPIDVQALGCDFLMCSAYKFYGPHIGVLYGRYDLLAALPVYKVRPSKDEPPYRWETGTLAYELIAGLKATLDYLTEIGRDYGHAYKDQFPGLGGRQLELKAALAVIGDYERELVTQMIDVLRDLPGVYIAGITDPERYDERVPTVIFRLDSHSPQAIVTHLAQRHIYAWSGHNYAIEPVTRLGYIDEGFVRVGLAHYNTADEVERLRDALNDLVSG